MTTGGGGDWGGVRTNTTDSFTMGAHQLFAGGPETPFCYGSDALDGHGSCLTDGPIPPGVNFAQRCNELFDRVGVMLGNAFRYGRTLGVKTCVGREAPLGKPWDVPNATSQELYEGIFRRIQATMPIDYYWTWTSEGWGGRHPPGVPVTDKAVTDVVEDFLAMEAAHKVVNPEFKLATCGWTLGYCEDCFSISRGRVGSWDQAQV